MNLLKIKIYIISCNKNIWSTNDIIKQRINFVSIIYFKGNRFKNYCAYIRTKQQSMKFKINLKQIKNKIIFLF